MSLKYFLGEIAKQIGAKLIGDENLVIDRIEPLGSATAGAIAFLSNKKFAKDLGQTSATAVILNEPASKNCPVPCLVMDNPYLGYAKVAQLLNPVVDRSGIEPTAVISDKAEVSDSCYIGANVVIGENSKIALNVRIKAGTVIGANVQIGEDSIIDANVTIYDNSLIGKRTQIHSGAVIGSDGFGLAPDGDKWVKIPQLGRVVIGNDVEIGSNTSIDRGALGDTRLENGVKLDNLIQVAHNVVIGENTAIAACCGIAGSTVIGRNCTFAGAVGIAGHITICDHVHVTGRSIVTKSIKEPGVYSSGTPLQQNRDWHRSAIRYKQLDSMAERLKKIEKELEQLSSK